MFYSPCLCLNWAVTAKRCPVWSDQAAGEAFESQGDHDLAIAEYRKVLTLDPGRAGIHFRIGRALVARLQQTNSRTEDSAEALKEFEEELQVDPTNANAAYEMAEIYRKSQQLEKAQELFEVALENYPHFEGAQLGLRRPSIALRQPAAAT